MTAAPVPRPVALVFPGQGSQSPGMLDALPDQIAVTRLLDAADAWSDLDLRQVLAQGRPEELADTRAAQPLLFLADWAWGSALREAGLRPAALAGHSLGELAALAVAEVFSVEAGLELVIERSRLMSQCTQETPGGMVAVIGMEAAEIAEALVGVEGVWLANDNAPGQVIISGTHAGLHEASKALAEAGARRLIPLDVSGAFHSPLMEPAAAPFAALLESVDFRDAAFPVISNSEPRRSTDAEVLRARLARQMTSPVRWTETMQELLDCGIDTLVEAGPGTVLEGLANRVEGLTVYSVEETGAEAICEEVC